ncbi:hypothetical protein C5S31_02700 [ANME-1 cluster archaeon GoMg2]|nr:hypothetical protein [ANME-1 cluster archaeon GoMg2]
MREREEDGYNAPILLYLFLFLFVWQFGGYPLLMVIVALKPKPENKEYSFQPFVSIIVPIYITKRK